MLHQHLTQYLAPLQKPGIFQVFEYHQYTTVDSPLCSSKWKLIMNLLGLTANWRYRVADVRVDCVEESGPDDLLPSIKRELRGAHRTFRGTIVLSDRFTPSLYWHPNFICYIIYSMEKWWTVVVKDQQTLTVAHRQRHTDMCPWDHQTLPHSHRFPLILHPFILH